jgi:hypothetical protein
MSGISAWQKKIELDISTAQKQLETLEREVNNKKYTIDIGVNKEQLESVIANLDKMLKSLGNNTGDFKQFEKLAGQLESITTEVQSLSTAFGKIDGNSGAKSLLSSIQNIDSSLTTLTKHITEVNTDFGNIGKNANANVSQIQNAQKATEGLASATKDLSDAQSKVSGNKTNLSSENTSGVNATAEAMGNLAEQTKNASSAKEQFASANNNVSSSATTTSDNVTKEAQAIEEASSSLKKFQNAYNTYSAKPKAENQNSNYQASLDKLNQINETIRKITSKPIDLITDTELDQLKTAQTRGNELLQIFKSMTAGDKGSTLESRLKFINKMQDTLSRNTNFSKEAQQQIETYISMLKTMGSDAPFEEIRSGFYGIVSAEKAAGNEGKRLIDIFKSKALYNNISSLVSMYFSWYRAIGYVKEAITTVVDLDTALVDLQKTTTMSTSELNDFYYSANDVAKQMGVTTEEIIDQASAWSRLGYSSGEAATEMAKLSSQFASISPGMDVDTATDGMVSTMKAFGIEVDDVKREILDNINIIGNTAATSNEEIVDMLTRSSAAMAEANNSLEQTIALESASVEITRNAESTGTAFKTLAMRIRGKFITASIYSNVCAVCA